MHKPIRTILYGEAVLNGLIAVAAVLLPESFIALFTDQPGGPVAEAFARWYGVAMVALVYILVKALRKGSIDALKPVVQAYLIADVLRLATIWMLAEAVEQWAAPTLIYAAITVTFAIVRVYALLWRIDLLANLHPANWSRGKRHKTQS